MKWTRRAVLLFGIVNAVLYSSLLPMWEGFDETFHYAYVQHVSTTGTLGVLWHTPVSEEIWQALQLQPVSNYIQGSTGAPINFSDYFRMSGDERSNLRARLEMVPSGAKYQPHAALQSYEVHQAPLVYLLLALPDRLFSGLPITRRVFILRLLLSVDSVVLMFVGIRLVAAEMGLPVVFELAAMFCTFCSQMFYGATAHISNDSLAVPMMLFVIWASIRAFRNPGPKTFAVLGGVLSVALLTKSYYLAEVPLAVFVVGCQVWRRRARWKTGLIFAGVVLLTSGPLYARNICLYGNLSGDVEPTVGFGPRQMAEGLVHIPWGRTIAYMATSSLWTGNNSFTTFSARTLYLALALLAAGLVLGWWRHGWRMPEAITGAAVLLFCLALLYIALAWFSTTKGAAIAAPPWYAQVVLAPVLLIVFSGMSRSRNAGRSLAMLILLLWTYFICATYAVKLIPLYGGYGQGRAHLGDLYAWYLGSGAERMAILSSLCLTNASWIYSMTALGVLLAASVGAILVRRLYVIEITVR